MWQLVLVSCVFLVSAGSAGSASHDWILLRFLNQHERALDTVQRMWNASVAISDNVATNVIVCLSLKRFICPTHRDEARLVLPGSF